MISGVHRRFDDCCVDHVDLLEQIGLELGVSLLKLHRPHHGRSRCFNGSTAFVVLVGLHDWRVQVLEAICEALLNGEDVSPCISPGLRSLNDLNKWLALPLAWG